MHFAVCSPKSEADPLLLPLFRRTIHNLLVGMHVAALLAQGAYVLKYTLPVSDTLCLVAFRAGLALLLCYDVSL